MTENQPLATTDVCELLRNARRQHVVRCLAERDGPMEFSSLVDRVAAMEHAGEGETITAAERKSVYVALHQTHVPKLCDAGAVSYSPRGEGVVPAAQFRVLRRSLAALEANCDGTTNPGVRSARLRPRFRRTMRSLLDGLR